jgi:hypothetical protein
MFHCNIEGEISLKSMEKEANCALVIGEHAANFLLDFNAVSQEF